MRWSEWGNLYVTVGGFLVLWAAKSFRVVPEIYPAAPITNVRIRYYVYGVWCWHVTHC